jgi:IclR family transcriptional regulator, KDG regulon repressor
MIRSVVKSASRTLQVLELFSEHRRPLRLHEICEHLKYPQSSATHLMKSLLRLGYVNYNRATRTYLPTNRVSSLGNWLTSVAFGQERFHALANRILAATDETVAVSTQNDLFIQYMIIKTPDHDWKMPPQEGRMRLLTDSTSGIALLSRMSNRQIDKICRNINYYERDPTNRIDLDALMHEINWTRHVGYCARMDAPSPGIGSIAFPLDETLHGIPLAIGIGGYKDRLKDRISDLLAAVRQAIAEFASEALAEDLQSFDDSVDDPLGDSGLIAAIGQRTEHTPGGIEQHVFERRAVAH